MPYLYALVRSGAHPALPEGAHGEPLRVVSAGDVAAVVGAREDVPAVSRESLAAHDRVVRALFALGPTLPARFGQVLDDERLQASLRDRQRAFADALALVDGCVQMTVRVALAEPPLSTAPAHDDRTSGRAYLEARRARRAPPELAALRRALSSYSRAERSQVTEPPRALASLYQLVPKGSVAAWRMALEQARAESGARVQVTGPWPPYAFVPEVA